MPLGLHWTKFNNHHTSKFNDHIYNLTQFLYQVHKDCFRKYDCMQKKVHQIQSIYFRLYIHTQTQNTA